MRANYGRMIMCHMVADTESELMEMADKIGVQRKWVQRPPKSSSLHFDISLGKRALAVKAGAKEVDMRTCAAMAFLQTLGQPMGDPATAVERWRALKTARALARAGTKVE